ncbi:conserved Plasmodium protein, unknown function [Plasmodium ovale]|uniref:Uncharacterized protein n=1 Tax=Plasmodium ovale TaxID=36330 RepID=A0A1D3RD73_PLAOA|nr:conserved Plasmodium protein, unknown function [Plasmodium ovale]
MSLSITIKGGLPSSDSEEVRVAHKKSASNMVHKTKLRKENIDSRKIKSVVKKEKTLSAKLTDSTSLTSVEKKNVKEKRNSQNRKYLLNTSLSSKASVLSRFVSQNSQHDGSSKSTEKKKVQSATSGKVVKPNTKLVRDTLEGGKGVSRVPPHSPPSGTPRSFTSHLTEGFIDGLSDRLTDGFPKSVPKGLSKNGPKIVQTMLTKNNSPKRNKTVASSNINTNVNKKNHKLGKLLAQSDKSLKKKKNKIGKSFVNLKKNMDTMKDDNTGKFNQTDSSQNGNEKKRKTYKGENKGTNGNYIEAHITEGQKDESLSNLQTGNEDSTGAEKQNTTGNAIYDPTEHLGDDFSFANPNTYRSETSDVFFTRGCYEPSRDIFKEEKYYYNANEVGKSLLPGYKSVTFDGLNDDKREALDFNDTGYAQQNEMYSPNVFYPPHNYTPHLSSSGPNEAYYVHNQQVLSNYLFTSADVAKGSIHRQYNSGVAYPYGVPFIDIAAAVKQCGEKKQRMEEKQRGENTTGTSNGERRSNGSGGCSGSIRKSDCSN